MAVEKKSIAKPEVKAEAPAKAAAKKPAAPKKDVKAKVVLQLGEREYTEAALVKIAQDVWKFDLGKDPAELKKVELYIKPEENKVYYVMNGESGDFNI